MKGGFLGASEFADAMGAGGGGAGEVGFPERPEGDRAEMGANEGEMCVEIVGEGFDEDEAVQGGDRELGLLFVDDGPVGRVGGCTKAGRGRRWRRERYSSSGGGRYRRRPREGWGRGG